MDDGAQDNDGRTQRERMLAGDLYLAEDPEIARDRLRASQLMGAFNRTDANDETGRQRILRQLFGTVGPGVEIRPPFYCDLGYQIRIGARTFVNVGLIALDIALIAIGDDVQIGPNVQLLTPTHPIEPGLRRAKFEASKPIVIGDNVWLGGGAIVLPGVTVGENTVVGAGAVVSRDLPEGVVAVGNPARVVREIE